MYSDKRPQLESSRYCIAVSSIHNLRYQHFLSANCTHYLPLQALVPLGLSVPPAPPAPLQALCPEGVVVLPAPGLSPLQALLLLLGQHPVAERAAPASRPAMDKPASIFFRSLASINFLLSKGFRMDIVFSSPGRINVRKYIQ